MTQEETEKKADEYIEMFTYITTFQNYTNIVSVTPKKEAIKNAIKLVDELIKQAEKISKRHDIILNGTISDLQQINECLTNKLK